MNQQNQNETHKVAFFVDDDADYIRLIPYMVKHPGFEIRTHKTSNGYQAIDEIIKIKPDVLFMDFGLPRANGGQILPILKSVQNLSNLKIYFVTGFAIPEVLPLVHGLEYSGILHKGPNLKAEILQILNDLDAVAA